MGGPHAHHNLAWLSAATDGENRGLCSCGWQSSLVSTSYTRDDVIADWGHHAAMLGGTRSIEAGPQEPPGFHGEVVCHDGTALLGQIIEVDAFGSRMVLVIHDADMRWTTEETLVALSDVARIKPWSSKVEHGRLGPLRRFERTKFPRGTYSLLTRGENSA